MQHLQDFCFFPVSFYHPSPGNYTPEYSAPSLLLSCSLSLSPTFFRFCLPSSPFHASSRLEAKALRRDVITDAVLMSGCIGESATGTPCVAGADANFVLAHRRINHKTLAGGCRSVIRFYAWASRPALALRYIDSTGSTLWLWAVVGSTFTQEESIQILCLSKVQIPQSKGKVRKYYQQNVLKVYQKQCFP